MAADASLDRNLLQSADKFEFGSVVVCSRLLDRKELRSIYFAESLLLPDRGGYSIVKVLLLIDEGSQSPSKAHA
ncbi:MAG: hypothetical protein ACLQBA_06000 [Candidatus Binataceae bacterium]